MARPVVRLLFSILLASAAFTTGCLGGGGTGTSSQYSLGSVKYLGHTVVQYDSLVATIVAKGQLNLPGVTDLNEVRIFTDSQCLVQQVGFGIHKTFAESGVEVTLPSAAITDLYVSTNTSDSCFYFFQFVPKYDAPPTPIFGRTSPSSPSRTTNRPYIYGDVSATTVSVRFFLDNSCKVSAGTGTAAQYKSTGIQLTLQSDAESEIYAMAYDAFGKSSECSFISRFLHDSRGPSAPLFVSTLPVSPSGTSLTPLIKGTVALDIQTVALFKDASCLEAAGSGTAEDFRTTGIQVSTGANASTSFYAIGIDDKMVPSDCAFLTIFTHDSIVPAAPIFSSIAPTSPSKTTLVPRVAGTVSADTQQVQLFEDNTCKIVIGSGTKAVFEGAGIPAGVRANEITTIFGVAIDAAGNSSACTQLGSFQHDTIPPDPPVFGLSTPASPNNKSTTPRIAGTSDISAINVRIYNDEACTNQIGSGSTEQFESPGIQVTVAGNTTTTLYATSDDSAGNTSVCSALANYAHSTVPAPPPGFFQASPPSPTRITNLPYIVGTAATTVTSVTLYSDSECLGSLGAASRSVFVTSGVQITVAMNAISSIYAVSEDVYGNTSACTLMTTYIHNTVRPLNPIFTSVTPLSPNNQSTNPTIKGTLTFDPLNVLQPNEVSLYDGPLCLNKIGTGTPTDFSTTGLTASVPANTTSFIFSRVFDAAGNSSDCTPFTEYTHDALVPGRPLLSAITPATPSYTADTKLVGTIGTTTDFLAPTNLVIYSDANCQNVLKTAPVSSFTSGTYTLSVAKNTTTSLFGAVFNPVGTASPCTLLVNYRHSDVGPSGLTAIQSLDGSVILNWLPDNIARPVPNYEIRRSLQSNGPYTTIAEGIIGTTYTDSAVSNAQTYYYVVAARNITGVSKNSGEIAHTVNVAVPNQTMGLSALPGPAQVTLNWLGAGDNMTYSIRRSVSAGGPFTTIATKLTNTTYIDRPLVNGTTYFYIVTGSNPAGTSAASNETSATPLAVPDAPTNLQLSQVESAAECGGSFGILLTWTPSNYFSSFTVSRGMNSTTGTPVQSTTSTSWFDCGPIDGSDPDYNYYSVTANWGQLQSAPSNQVVFVNDGAGNLTVLPGNGLVQINWNFLTGASQYELYRSSLSGGPYSLISSSGSTSYIDTAVTNGQSYFYKMQAVFPNDSARGRWTPEQGASPGAEPEAPTNLIVSVNSSRNPVLSWSAPHAFNFFRVYRAPSPTGPYDLAGTSNTGAFTDTTPLNGWNYYRVTRVWGTSESSPTNTVQVRIGFPLTISSTNAVSSINLGWSSVSGASSYRILRSLTSSGPYTLLNTSTVTSFSDTTAAANTGYFYVVQPAFPDTSLGQFSNEVSGVLSNATLATGLSVISTTQSSVSLEWPRISGASSYKVFRSTALGGPYTLVGQQVNTGLTVTGLAGLTEHFFKYSFVRSGVESAASTAVSARTWSTPSPPVVTPGNNLIALGWGVIAGSTSYSVLRSSDGETFATIASGLTLPQYNDSSALNSQIYVYRVVAHFPAGESRTSSNSTAVTPGLTPRTPTNLSVTKNLDGSDVELSWSPIAGATFYRIYRATTSGGPYSQVSQTSNSLNNTVTGHAAGTKYYFVVTAAIGSLESSYSNEVSIIPTASPNAPLATVNGTGVSVTWSPVAGASQYYLQRSTDRFSFATVSGPLASTSFLDTSVLPGQSYSYRFLPLDSTGTQLALSLISVSVNFGILPLSPPSLLGFNSSNTSVNLSWSQVPNADDFLVYRSVTAGGPFSLIATTNSLNYLDAGLTPDTSYFYVVSSRNSSGNTSAFSNEVSIRLGSQPTNLVALASNRVISLSWDTVLSASGYSVYRSQVSGGPYGRIASGVASPAFADTTVENDITYFYVVRAEFGAELSISSTEASAIGIRRVDLQVPIELVDQSISSDSTTQTFDRTLTTLDTTNFDGTVSYEFEAVGTNSDNFSREVRLVNQAGTVMSQIVFPANTLDRTRLRTSFTPTAGNQQYRIQTEGTSSSGQIEVATARLLVTQSAASRTAIYIPLLSSSAGAFTGDREGPIHITNNTSYEPISSAPVFKKESSRYAELIAQNPWRLETLVSATGSAVGSVALYNTTRNGHVDDTESMFFGENIQLSVAPFQEGVTGFSSANESDSYQVMVRCLAECEMGQARIYKAGLWVQLRNLEKARIFFRTGLGSMPSALTHYDQQITRIDLNRFTNPIAFFQATARVVMGMDAGLFWISSIGANDSLLGSPVATANSEMAINSNTKSLYRSGAISLNSGNRYVPSTNPSGSTLMISDSAIVIDISH